jgi:hypothetical protein
MKILLFFLFFGVIFGLLDPDPATQINAEPDTDPGIRNPGRTAVGEEKAFEQAK